MRRLDDWLKGYLEYTKYSEAPESFHLWTGVGTIAGALRRKVYIKELYYEWTPNFYIVLVARPGIATKSTSLDVGKFLLKELKGVHFGPSSMTWQALIPALSEAHEMVLMPDARYYPMSCLTFYSSELGSLIDLDDKKMMTVLTDLWDGKTGEWDRATKTTGTSSAINPWINILAATTPAWLSDNLPRQMISGGFMSRTIFVYADRKRQIVSYPSRLVYDRDVHKTLSENLLHDLEQIAMLKGEFRLTDAAYEYGDLWNRDHNATMQKSQEDLVNILARKQTHLHKLAMVISASARDDLTINEEDLAIADTLLGALEQNTRRVFRLIQTTESAEKIDQMISIVASNGAIPKADLYRTVSHRMTYKEFSDALEAGRAAGYIVEEVRGNLSMIVPIKAP